MASHAPENNFDLIRLFAAGQVMLWHGVWHFGLLKTWPDWALDVFNFFPGVPIFFFISGFLISASFERSRTMGQYALNRVLRIFPALWICFFLSVTAVALSGYFSTVSVSLSSAVLWVLAQLSFLQFYNPDFMRGYGLGVLNGSLWTIPVELQFYVIMPVLGLLATMRRSIYLGLFALFIALNALNSLYLSPVHGESTLIKLFNVSFFPWVCMFMLGHLAQRNWARLRGMLEGRLIFWILAYIIVVAGAVMLEDASGLRLSANKIAFPIFIVLAGLVLAAAYTKPHLSKRWLGGTDISYGVYIFHGPVYNLWFYLEMEKSYLTMTFCMAVTVVLSILSWKLIELPALRLKRSTLFAR